MFCILTFTLTSTSSGAIPAALPMRDPQAMSFDGRRGANRRRYEATDHDGDPRVPDDILDGTMTANDPVFVLEHLSFHGKGHDRLAAVKLDRHARDYLINLLRSNGPV
jgi:hypothetical protein